MKSRPFLLPLLLPVAFGVSPVGAQPVITPGPLPDPPTVLYRQIMPDGRIVYSDQRKPGARVDHTLNVDLPPPGSTWSVNGNPRPPAKQEIRATPVQQVATIPSSGGPRTVDEAAAELIRAEMLLEDARRKRDAAHAPRLEELGDIGPRSAYAERQRALAREIAQAEAGVDKAKADLAAARRR